MKPPVLAAVIERNSGMSDQAQEAIDFAVHRFSGLKIGRKIDLNWLFDRKIHWRRPL
jgi:hypothetical protein